MTGKQRLCPTCGRVARCEDHHPLGEVHAPEVTVPACTGDCHPTASERQRRAGVALEHDQEHSFAEKVWAYDAGLSDLLALMAFNRPELGEQEVRAVERSSVAFGRLVDTAARSVGEPGIQGPSPRANTLRVARRRNSRRPDRSLPAHPHEADDTLTPERMQELFGVMAAATATLPQDGGVDEMTHIARTLADRGENLAERFAELEERHADTLARCIAVGKHHREVSTAAIESVERPEDCFEIGPITQSFAAYIDHYLAFAVDVAQARDVEEAEAALERFAAAVLL